MRFDERKALTGSTERQVLPSAPGQEMPWAKIGTVRNSYSIYNGSP